MKRRYRKIICFLLTVFSVVGCSADNEVDVTYENLEYTEIYGIVFDSFIELDKGLNTEMSYIAIDVESLLYITEVEVEKLFKYMEKYGIPVISQSFDSLEEEGMVGIGNEIDGILISVNSFEITDDNRVVVKGEKFRSGDGAIGVKCGLIRREESWQKDYADITWKS